MLFVILFPYLHVYNLLTFYEKYAFLLKIKKTEAQGRTDAK